MKKSRLGSAPTVDSSEHRASECVNPAMEAQRDIQELEEQRDTRHESVSQHSLQTHTKNSFHCDHCNQLYPNKSRLREHISRTHLSLVRFKCGVCSYTNWERLSIAKHWKRRHTGPPIISDLEFPCEICSKKFSTEDSLRKHISRRHGDLLKCPLCVESRIFRNVEALRVHFLSSHGREPWENHQFSKYTQARQQVSKVKRDTQNNKYKCYVCKMYYFPFRGRLFTHIIQAHYKIYPYDCKLCLFQTERRRKIEDHYLLVHSNSEFQNLIENQEELFSSKQIQISNQKKKNIPRNKKKRENSMEVQIMGDIIMEFELNEPNATEMIIEKFEPMYVNSSGMIVKGTMQDLAEPKNESEHSSNKICGENASIEEYKPEISLEEPIDNLPESENEPHLPIEICDENTSRCKICRAICLKKHSPYREHIRPVHGNTKFRFQCVQCGYRNYHIGRISTHIKTRHVTPLQKNIKTNSECQFCFKKINPGSDMDIHIKENHSSDLACVECGEMFKSIWLLRDHVTNAHGFQKYVEWLKDKIYEVKKRVEQMNAPQLTCYICEMQIITNPMKANLIFHILRGHFQVKILTCKFCSHQCMRISTMCRHIETMHNDGRICRNHEDLRNYWEPIISGQEDIVKSLIAVESSTKVESEDMMDQSNSKKLAYRCPKCSYTSPDTTSVLDLKLHLQMNHFTQEQIASPDFRYFFPCNICSTNCWSQNNLDIHNAKNHSLEICCRICETLVSVDVLKKHFQSFHGEVAWMKHKSSIKNQINIKVKNLLSNASTGFVRCSICSEDFKTRDSLLSHVMLFHFNPRNEIIQCEHCSYVSYNSDSMMINHMIKHHSGRSIPIHGAETISFTVNDPVDQRNRSVNTIKLEISSTRAASSEQRTNECFICGQELGNENALTSHIEELHSDISLPYFCQLCHEFFTHEFSFETHWYLAHCETQPLHSRIAFQSKSVSFQSAFLSRFPCKFCNTYFATEAELALHAQNAEVHPNVYLCFMCDFSSESSQAVRAHIKVKHPSHKAQNLTEHVVDVTTPVVGNESTDLIEQVSSTTQSIINQSESTPDLTIPSCSNPAIKADLLDLHYNTVTDCPQENLNSELIIKQEKDVVDDIDIKEEELSTFSSQSLNETSNQPRNLESSKNSTSYLSEVSHPENPIVAFYVQQLVSLDHNYSRLEFTECRDRGKIVGNADTEIKQEKLTEVKPPRVEQRQGVQPPQRGQGEGVKRCKREVGGTKRGRGDPRNIHPRGETSQVFVKKSRPGPNFVQEAVSHPTPALTCLPTAPVYSGASSACCSPDLLAGSGARGRRVTSRPYPDSLPPVPGGCLPCSVQL